MCVCVVFAFYLQLSCYEISQLVFERCTFEDAQCGVVKTPVKFLPKSMSDFGDNRFELRGFGWEDA